MALVKGIALFLVSLMVLISLPNVYLTTISHAQAPSDYNLCSLLLDSGDAYLICTNIGDCGRGERLQSLSETECFTILKNVAKIKPDYRGIGLQQGVEAVLLPGVTSHDKVKGLVKQAQSTQTSPPSPSQEQPPAILCSLLSPPSAPEKAYLVCTFLGKCGTDQVNSAIQVIQTPIDGGECVRILGNAIRLNPAQRNAIDVRNDQLGVVVLYDAKSHKEVLKIFRDAEKLMPPAAQEQPQNTDPSCNDLCFQRSSYYATTGQLGSATGGKIAFGTCLLTGTPPGYQTPYYPGAYPGAGTGVNLNQPRVYQAAPPGKFGCDQFSACWCSEFAASAGIGDPNLYGFDTSSIPGTDPVIDDPEEIDGPKRPNNDVACDAPTRIAINAKSSGELVPVGETMTIEGTVMKFSNQCRGYSYTCRAQQNVGCTPSVKVVKYELKCNSCERFGAEPLPGGCQGEISEFNFEYLIDAIVCNALGYAAFKGGSGNQPGTKQATATPPATPPAPTTAPPPATTPGTTSG